MTAEVANGVANTVAHPNGDVNPRNPNRDRRRRRRKQKKNNKSEDGNGGDVDSPKENSDPQKFVQSLEQVEVEYVPEKAELDGELDEEFKKVFEKFSLKDGTGSEEENKKEETAADAASKKKANSDSEEEQDAQPKEKGISNKKKKLQRRMKIAELKQICTRPDVVEVWDATAADPTLLVYLKSCRNTVPVPRHWSQKRKFLQEIGFGTGGASRCCRTLTTGDLS